jgi:MipA family protein
MRVLAPILVACLLGGAAGALRAAPADTPQNSPATGKAGSPWRIGIALGYGARSNPLIQSQAIPIAVDIDVAWFGKRWFFDNGDLGLTLLDRSAGTLNLVARANSDRVFFGKTNARFVQVSAVGAPLASPVQLKVPDRNYAVELGFEWLADGRWGKLMLSGFHDVSKAHEGFSADAEYAYPIYGSHWTFEPTVTLRYKSAALNDYYWGVRASEANVALSTYQAGAGLNWQVGARANYYLTSHWRLAAGLNVERLSNSIVDSPLVRERDVTGYFAGLAYQF